VEENIDAIKKSTETLLDGSEEVGLEVNAEKTRYILITLFQKAGKIHTIKVVDRFSDDVTELKYLGKKLIKIAFT
jgi:uncharacterized protein YnzC (UPF0291/DUF896 family)